VLSMLTRKMPSKRIPPAVAKGEWRGVVDLIAIRKSGRQLSGDILKRGGELLLPTLGCRAKSVVHFQLSQG
jgi:hypothetical protein